MYTHTEEVAMWAETGGKPDFIVTCIMSPCDSEGQGKGIPHKASAQTDVMQSS
jgi:hypothetical protein